jgi:hypothetical protein
MMATGKPWQTEVLLVQVFGVGSTGITGYLVIIISAAIWQYLINGLLT